MYSIGRFASIGRVTVRMLRHWDELGLLPPAHVDPVTGYRSYAPEQLADLVEIVRLRDLGVGLADIGRIRRAGVGHPASRRTLEAVREALRLELTAGTDRLARFDAYLGEAEGAPAMTDTIEVEYRAVPAVRVATLTRAAGGFGSQHIGPVVGPMFPEVAALLSSAGVPNGAAVAIYTADDSGDGARVLVTAGFELETDVQAVHGLDVHVLPAIDRAAVAVHRGPVDAIDRSWMALVDRIEADGAVRSDAAREVYRTPGDRPQSEWVTRLVQPVRVQAGARRLPVSGGPPGRSRSVLAAGPHRPDPQSVAHERDPLDPRHSGDREGLGCGGGIRPLSSPHPATTTDPTRRRPRLHRRGPSTAAARPGRTCTSPLARSR